MIGSINTVECRNLLTGEIAWFLVDAWGWKTRAKEEAAARWNVCWDSISVKNCSKEDAA